MKAKIILIYSFLLFPFLSGMAQQHKSQVFILSTIHGAHKANPNYSYDSLFAFVTKYNPDIIGVEIRNEDIDSSAVYLKSNYPFEMYSSIKKYTTKQVLGFDWLGADLAGKAIPANYWKEMSTIKKLERKIAADSTFFRRLSVLNVVNAEKVKIAKTASLRELNDGRYDLINHIYYAQLNTLLKDTEYQLLSDFYQQRDDHIAHNIVEIIKNNKGKKMIFLEGADHRDCTLRKVAEVFGNTIELNRLE